MVVGYLGLSDLQPVGVATEGCELQCQHQDYGTQSVN